MPAAWIIPRELTAVFSKRPKRRRNSLSRPKSRSTPLRRRAASRSKLGGSTSLAFLPFSGITGGTPSQSHGSRLFAERSALSPANASGGLKVLPLLVGHFRRVPQVFQELRLAGLSGAKFRVQRAPRAVADHRDVRRESPTRAAQRLVCGFVRIFPPPTGTAVRTDNAASNRPQTVVEPVFRTETRLQTGDCGGQRAVRCPPIERGKHRFPRPEFLGPVTPRRTRPQNPADAIPRGTSRHRWPPRRLGLREEVCDHQPFGSRQSLSRQDRAAWHKRITRSLPTLENRKRPVSKQSLVPRHSLIFG